MHGPSVIKLIHVDGNEFTLQINMTVAYLWSSLMRLSLFKLCNVYVAIVIFSSQFSERISFTPHTHITAIQHFI